MYFQPFWFYREDKLTRDRQTDRQTDIQRITRDVASRYTHATTVSATQPLMKRQLSFILYIIEQDLSVCP